MNFQDAIKYGFKNWLNFTGRSSRSEYWLWTLFVTMTLIITLVLDKTLFHMPHFEAGPISNIVSLVLLIPGLSNAFRRMHDYGKSAWWLLLGLIPLIGGIVILVWFCKKGTDGPNRFGPDPLLNEPINS